MTYVFDIIHLMDQFMITWRPDYTVFPNGTYDAKQFMGVPWLASRIAAIYCLPVDHTIPPSWLNNPGKLDDVIAAHLDLQNRTILRTSTPRAVSYKSTANTLILTFE